MATVRQRLSGEPRPNFWRSTVTLLGLLLALVAIGWPFQSRGRARLYAHDAQLDLIDLDAAKEEFWVGRDIQLAKDKQDRLQPGDPAPNSVAELKRDGFLGSWPRLVDSGEFTINPLGKDPAFTPARPVVDGGIPFALPVEFSEVSTTIVIEEGAGSKLPDPAPDAVAASDDVSGE